MEFGLCIYSYICVRWAFFFKYNILKVKAMFKILFLFSIQKSRLKMQLKIPVKSLLHKET
jgi:hypothetical protein